MSAVFSPADLVGSGPVRVTGRGRFLCVVVASGLPQEKKSGWQQHRRRPPVPGHPLQEDARFLRPKTAVDPAAT